MNKNIEARIKSNFNCTLCHDYLGGYLLADGYNVDIRSEGNDHRIICNVFNQSRARSTSSSGWFGVVGMLKRGHMRTSPECNGFEFMKQPTQRQFDAIKHFVEYNDCAEMCYFEQMDANERTHYIGNFFDFVNYLKDTYGEYTYY